MKIKNSIYFMFKYLGHTVRLKTVKKKKKKGTFFFFNSFKNYCFNKIIFFIVYEYIYMYMQTVILYFKYLLNKLLGKKNPFS